MITNAPVDVPVEWLDKYGITDDQEEAVLQDPDGDGAATWKEYVMDTNPTNELSVLRLEIIKRSTDENLLAWTGSSNRVYTMYWNIDMLCPLTNVLFYGYQPADSGQQAWTNAMQAAEQRLNYRVKVGLP